MRVLIVDDHPLTSFGLAALLSATQGKVDVHSVHNRPDAQLALAHAEGWDWVFLDINIDGDPEHLLFSEFCRHSLIHRTVLISAEPAYALVHQGLLAGVRGFIPKSTDPNIFLAGFEKIKTGLVYLPAEFQFSTQHELVEHRRAGGLSPRLQDVERLLMKGSSNKLIARHLELSTHTVKEYVSTVLAHHQVANRLELVLKQQTDRR
jgi:DNA-binding NarL/FixJ family response regulator